MSRIVLFAATAFAGSVALAGAAFAQASTIRIEPRPYYGATITLEQGVRVWRPLPTTKYVIINPDNRTPLNLSLADIKEHSTSENHYYDHGAGQSGNYVGGGGFGLPRGLPHRHIGDRRRPAGEAIPRHSGRAPGGLR